MVRSKPGGGPPSVRASEALLRIASVSSKLGGGASEALLRIASVSSKLGGGASEALAVRGARGGVSPRRRGPCRRPHCSADAAEDVTAPMLAAIARHGRGAALEKVSYPRRAECLSRPLRVRDKPVGVSNEQMVRQLEEIFSSPRAVDPFSRVHVCEPVRCPPRFIRVQVASICAISWIFGGSARSRKRRFGVMIISSHASTGGTLSAPRVQI